jgi:pimeloyl-ACP methyl ester carboxylesterase
VRAAVSAIAAGGREQPRRLDFDGRVGVLWGSDDVLVPVSHARGVQAALPHAELEFWPGMGHHPQQQHRPELAAFVERYAGDGEAALVA